MPDSSVASSSASFGRLAANVAQELQPASVLDAGCGTGLLVESLRARGVEAYGVDISEKAIAQVPSSVREHCWAASLTEPLPRRYDLITCMEVMQHIDPADAEKVITNLCNATDRLLLSTCPFGSAKAGDPAQVNVQPPEVWAGLLASEGFLRDIDHDASYLTPWAALYRRTDATLSETVQRYERAWWGLHGEVADLRGSLVGLQRRFDEIAALPQRTVEPDVEELEEEVLRLRDKLVGQTAELGTAQGRVAELEAWNQRYGRAARLLNILLRTPPGRFVWWLGASAYRRRQR